MLESNIIKVSLKSSKTIKTIPLHRWDTGMKLEFEGIDIPLNTTCQFETGNGEAMLQLVDTETKRVDIPNDLLGQYCYQDIRAHLYVTNSSYGMTVYDIFIPVIQREQPADHISPDNTQTIEEWITEQVGVVDDDRQSIENMSATASVDNNTGTPAVTVTKTTVSDHVNLDFAFVNIKGAKGDDGEDGKDGEDGVTPSFSIGTVTQVSSMSPPWVTVTGTDEEPVLNFGLPKGEDGEGVKLRNVNIYEDSGATRGKITTVSAVIGYTTYDIDLYNIRGAQGVAGDNFNEAHLYTDSGLPRVELTPYAIYSDGHKTYDIDFYNIKGEDGEDGTKFLPTETVSGSSVTFSDGADGVPVNELTTTIVTELGGEGWTQAKILSCGRNLFGLGDQSGERRTDYMYFQVPLPPGDYTISAIVTSTDTDSTTNMVEFRYEDDTSQYVQLSRGTRSSYARTFSKRVAGMRFYASNNNANSAGDTFLFKDIQLELGSSATSYEPYNGVVTTIDFDRTVFNGTLNVTTGVLTIDDDQSTVQLTPTEVDTLLGTNFIVSNCGEVSVKYKADIGLYVDNRPKELPAVSSADNGKVLGVASGVWTKVAAPSGLPAATSADEGKLLGVDSNGDWGKTNAFAEETWTFTLSDNTTVTKTLLVKVVS